MNARRLSRIGLVSIGVGCMVAAAWGIVTRSAGKPAPESDAFGQSTVSRAYLPDLSRHDTRPRPTARPAVASATAVVTGGATASPTTPASTPPAGMTATSGTPPRPEPFGTVVIEPDFSDNGSGSDIDSIGFWEAPDPADTLMLVTAKGNQRVEVWEYPFAGNELEALRHPIFGTDTKVNGVVVDQVADVAYIAISKPVSAVAVFDLPALSLVGHMIDGRVDLRGEPNLALLRLPDASQRLYVSADDIVHVHEPHTGAAIGDFEPVKGLETMYADEHDQVLYIPDENGGSGVYAYDPQGRPYTRGGASVFGAEGVFDSDTEGITAYLCKVDDGRDDGRGFFVVADQRSGATDFEFFDRRTWTHLGRMNLKGVSNTDGVASTQQAMPDYPLGLFAAVDDDKNIVGIGWDKVLAATGLGCGDAPPPSTATPTSSPTPRPSDPPTPDATLDPTATRAPTPGGTSEPTPTDLPPAATRSRGYLTTPGELAAIAAKAERGIEPYAAGVAEVLRIAGKKWDYKLDATEKCKTADDPKWLDDENGTAILYAKAMAFHLTGEDVYAEDVADILETIMVDIRVVDWDVEGRQCQLNFSWGLPELVGAADLIEDYWAVRTCQGPVDTVHGNKDVAAGPCKRRFQNWLAKMYYGVSYTAAGSMNNWGVAATNASAHIADYLWDRPEIALVHRQPDEIDGRTEIALSPAEAWTLSRRYTIDRMNGYRVDFIQDKTCDDFANASGQHDPARPPVKSQITELGIVPDDARRSEYCNIERYNGDYQGYPQLHVSLYVQQCELLLRRGDRSCYDNVDRTDLPGHTFPNPNDTAVAQTTHLRPGRGSVERAIKALIVDSGTEWRHDDALAVAYRYYVTAPTLEGIEAWPGQIERDPRCWQDVCFGTLTHALAPGERPGMPPVVPPPSDAGGGGSR